MPLPLSGKVAVLRNTLWWWWINKNRQTWSFPVAQQDISPFELVTTSKHAKQAREKKSSTWFLFSQSDASNCTQINAQMRGWVHRSKAKVHLRVCVCVCVCTPRIHEWQYFSKARNIYRMDVDCTEWFLDVCSCIESSRRGWWWLVSWWQWCR